MRISDWSSDVCTSDLELLAAGAYQLGGLPAMAAGLLDQVASEHDGVRLYASFLRAALDDAVRRAGRFWRRHPALTSTAADSAILAAIRGGDEAPGGMGTVTVELVRSARRMAPRSLRGADGRTSP